MILSCHPVFPRRNRFLPPVLVSLLWTTASLADGTPSFLAERIDPLLEGRCLRGARIGIRVQSLADGRILYDRNGTRPLAPASNLKIFTAAAALKVLGPAYRFPTTFHALGPIESGILKGPLFLKGWGAPDLVAESWWWMTQELRRLGLRRVEGDLVLDDTYFDRRLRPDGWPPAVVDRAYNAPVSALACNFGVVTVRVVPGTRAGDRPAVHLVPFRGHFQVTEEVSTRPGRSRVSVILHPGDGEARIRVSGSLPPGGSPWESLHAVDDPTQYAGHAFRDLAREAGIEIGGGVRTGIVPSEAIEIYRHLSRPLAAVVGDMNKHSNNFVAEMLVKGMAATGGDPPGTTETGIGVVRRALAEQGVALEGVEIRDGSGLADGNLATAAALVETLVRFGREFEVFPELVASLPVAGMDGTLEDRDAGGALRRRVRAKTGFLRRVESLSGYAGGPGGEILAFSLLVNAAPCGHGEVTALLDRVAAAIADGPGARAGGD